MLRRLRPGRAPASAAGLVVAVTLILAVGAFASWGAPALGATSKWEWDGLRRIVAIGDVHGRHDQLRALLQGTGLADDQLRWTGEKDHLVLCGDLIDRGPDDRAILDLVRRLQKQAESAGGRVHSLLGNHEVMNLVRDFRYVWPGGYAAFQADEKSGDRRKALAAYEKAYSGKGLSSAELRAAFDEKYPPGYLRAAARAFARKGPYGSWLLEQPTVVKINGVLFVHGGLTPEVAALGLDQINDRLRKSVRSVMASGLVLDTLLRTPAGFDEIRGAAAGVLQLAAQGRPVDRRLTRAAETLTEEVRSLAFALDGPLWYRGSSLDNERIERERVTTVLARLDARSMVVGHTVTKTGQVSSRFDGRLLRSDVGMGYGRKGYAVVFEKERISVLDPATRQVSLPFAEPAYGEGWAGGFVHLADAVLEQVLREAEVVERTAVSRGGQRAELWELKGEGLHLRGLFKDIEEEKPVAGRASSRRYEHEVAAYKLDRMLDRGLVPVVVLRDGEAGPGALRAVVETALDLVSIRSDQDLQGAGPEETMRAIVQSYGIGVEELREQVVPSPGFRRAHRQPGARGRGQALRSGRGPRVPGGPRAGLRALHRSRSRFAASVSAHAGRPAERLDDAGCRGAAIQRGRLPHRGADRCGPEAAGPGAGAVRGLGRPLSRACETSVAPECKPRRASVASNRPGKAWQSGTPPFIHLPHTRSLPPSGGGNA